ncbi:hypothetical protein P280DRAFT_477132 [Massarina eburnea CBS 473.64]|uniref:Uncharacterized protein n=1 Tax=Massarina eburnea CBS 473.64 TaxID=1395130 RepID=A0A6A6S8U6_9PLEO|nr:hypothetical protein P280DRAFT_477132 [Massarina eburnea CBS 473.64]
MPNSVVINNSSEELYLWSFGDNVSDQITVAPGASWSEGLHRGATNPGSSIKISKVPNSLWTSAPTLIVGYTLDPDKLWFSLDAVNGAPFAGHKLTLSSEGSTSNMVWSDGQKPAGTAVGVGNVNSDLVLTIHPGA